MPIPKTTRGIAESVSLSSPYLESEKGTVSILIAHSDSVALKKYKQILLRAGYARTFAVANEEAIRDFLRLSNPGMIQIAGDFGGSIDGGVEMIRRLRFWGYSRPIALIAQDPTIEEFCSAITAGANDYWVQGRNLKLPEVTSSLVESRAGIADEDWQPEAISRMGFFRSLGLSENEIILLTEFARDFPKRKELAARLGKTEVQLRKAFSRIYGKLEDGMSVDNPAQLTALLTMCAVAR